MSVSTITSKGQTTIPKDVREKLRLKPGDKVTFVARDDGTALMVPATRTAASLKGMLPPPPKPVSLADMERAIRGRQKP